jgi:hypothetical protein
MSVEQLCCVSLGIFLEAVTFGFGILVGATLRRKEPDHGPSQSRTKATFGRG